MEYSQLASCTLHLRRVDPERLNNEDQIEKQRVRLRKMCQLMDLEPVDINVKRSLKRKGQAFVTFSTPADATKALSLLQGFQMVKGGRAIEAEVVRVPADVMVEKFCSAQELEEHVKRRKADKGTFPFPILCSLHVADNYVDRKKALETPTAAQPTATAKRPGDLSAPGGRPTKTAKISKANVIPDEYLPPNNTLFVREVPEGYDVEKLNELFSRFPGFREVRTIPLPQFKGCAFVEYEANEGAIQAREALNGRAVEDKMLKVTYQKAG